MKRTIVDSTDKIIYKGEDANKVMDLLNADICGITEEDEVKHEKILRSAEWTGKLSIKVFINLRFRGIDDWNRGVYKDVDGPLHFGSVNHLFGWGETKEEVDKYFRENMKELEYYGNKFPCESHGGIPSTYVLTIID